jgi:hypothetical protein
MTFKHLIIYFLLSFTLITANASEGMWLPILLKKYNIEQMQQQGFKLSAEDIYDINNASLKDAVVGLVKLSNPFHHFCSGEVISNQGLVLTNHHCGYGAIQSHSSLENDYLTNGFWAMSKEEELVNEGIGACFLKKMEEVTTQVLLNIPENATSFIRDSTIKANIVAIEKEAIKETHYMAKVKPFFSGNEYYLSVYEIFRDVRLVGAPPSAIGKFGGDTDNWMWPRHTGDFSMFRIYADKDNNPADFSDENVPYKPIKHLEIATDGVQKGDFTMVMGYPGTTTEYLSSFGVALKTELLNPAQIKIRTKGLDLMKSDMTADAGVRIKYSAKAASMANSWKKWIGENKGLQRLDALNKKQQLESDFTNWVNKTEIRKNEYAYILPKLEELNKKISPFEIATTYFYETIIGSELVKFSGDFRTLQKLNKESSQEEKNSTTQKLKIKADKFYKNYNLETDKRIFTAFITFYYQDMPAENHPEIFSLINTKFKGDINAFADYVYAKSMYPHPEKTYKFIENYTPAKAKTYTKDPIFQIFNQSLDIYTTKINPSLRQYTNEITELNRIYVKGLREFQSDKALFPDANSTFRIAYGQIDNYKPKDAVSYFHQTSLKGIIEKDNPDIYDYDVPDKLKELYYAGNFGIYGNPDGSMPVCFTASNHTTGGNSGSPILNGNGQLIGINFDRNWEGTMSDIMYDPEMCRNIALDIRYVLFIIDKFAEAGHLVEEMSLTNGKPQREMPNSEEPLKQ